jgi:hypothetical protein
MATKRGYEVVPSLFFMPLVMTVSTTLVRRILDVTRLSIVADGQARIRHPALRSFAAEIDNGRVKDMWRKHTRCWALQDVSSLAMNVVGSTLGQWLRATPTADFRIESQRGPFFGRESWEHPGSGDARRLRWGLCDVGPLADKKLMRSIVFNDTR